MAGLHLLMTRKAFSSFILQWVHKNNRWERYNCAYSLQILNDSSKTFRGSFFWKPRKYHRSNKSYSKLHECQDSIRNTTAGIAIGLVSSLYSLRSVNVASFCISYLKQLPYITVSPKNVQILAAYNASFHWNLWRILTNESFSLLMSIPVVLDLIFFALVTMPIFPV